MVLLSRALLLFAAVAAATAVPQAHPARLAQIEEVRNATRVHWRAAVHARFARAAPGASKTLCGVKGSWKEAVQAAVKRGEVKPFPEALTAHKVPEEFDSAEHWPRCAKVINDIRDQSNCGCCWAFAGAEAASDRMCIASNASLLLPLSAEDVCFCGSGLFSSGCDGGQIDTPWHYIRRAGAVTGGQYRGTGPFGKGLCKDYSLPHCHHHGPQGDDPYPAEGQPGCPQETSPVCRKRCDADAAEEHSDWGDDKVCSAPLCHDWRLRVVCAHCVLFEGLYRGAGLTNRRLCNKHEFHINHGFATPFAADHCLGVCFPSVCKPVCASEISVGLIPGPKINFRKAFFTVKRF